MYFAVLIFINLFLVNITFVFGESMVPTLKDKQIALVLKVGTDYKYNDLVITNSQNPLGTHLVKRVVAVGGDHLVMDGHQIFLNGELLQEVYLAEEATYAERLELTVPEKSVFLMGDNRNFSKDSRDIGPIPVSDIIGKLILY